MNTLIGFLIVVSGIAAIIFIPLLIAWIIEKLNIFYFGGYFEAWIIISLIILGIMLIIVTSYQIGLTL